MKWSFAANESSPAARSPGTAIRAFRIPIQEPPRSRFPGRRNCEPSRVGLRRKLDACSIHVSAICTTTAAKAWAGTATTKRRSGKIPRLALSVLALKGNFPFATKRKGDSPSISIQLENGSLLVMKGTTQSFWQHSVPKTAKIAKPRINLTFRTIVLGEAEGQG